MAMAIVCLRSDNMPPAQRSSTSFSPRNQLALDRIKVMATAQLDKTLDTPMADDYGTITIRVVVLDKAMAAAPSPAAIGDTPADVEPDEVLPDTDKRPISTFLEEPKRGKHCCVFLINGQRQHAWDNQFIVRDLDLKYLRNRMIVVVDCDGLKPRATAELMRGHRLQFYEGNVYYVMEQRVIATLSRLRLHGNTEADALVPVALVAARGAAVPSRRIAPQVPADK
jgi:hypothetical protein